MNRDIIGFMKPLTRRLIALGSIVTRPMTVGVRGAVFDAEGRIFLVRHTYLPGWYLPGGGVDPGESAQQAIIRELREEGNVVVEGSPALFSLYLNARHSRRDHVALYIIRDWHQDEPATVPNREIAEVGFFSPGALPHDTTPATRRRVREIVCGLEGDEIW